MVSGTTPYVLTYSCSSYYFALPYVAALTPEHRQALAEWRGYSPNFVAWLQAQNLIGLFDGERIAFPVHEAQGHVIGCHYRLKKDGSWRYHPTGLGARPLIIGDISQAQTVYAAESQWDMLAVLDAFHWHIQPRDVTAAIATRGASNGRLIAGRCRRDATVYAFVQNDEAGRKWLAAVAAACGCMTFQVVTPQPHEDANDWTRAGVTRPDIEAAIAAAQPVSAAPDLHATPPKNVSNRVTLAEEADEPETAPFPLDVLPPAMATIIAAVSRTERVQWGEGLQTSANH